jgi:hypothetical protein
LAEVFEQKPQAKEVIANKLEIAEVTEELESLTKEIRQFGGRTRAGSSFGE